MTDRPDPVPPPGPQPPHHAAAHLNGERFRLYMLGVPAIALLALLSGAIVALAGFGIAHTVGNLLGPSWEGALRIAALLAAIAVLLPILAWLMPRLHGRPFASLIGPGGGFDLGLCLRSALLWAGLIGLPAAIAVLSGAVPLVDPDWGPLLLLVLLTLPLLPFQVAAEEMLCRGYLAQGFYLLLRHPMLAALPVALVFMALHGQVYAEGAWLDRLRLVLLSLLMSWATWRANRLEAAIGLHLGQNLLALYVLGALGPDSPSLLELPETADSTGTPAELLGSLTSFLMLAWLYDLFAFRLGWVVKRRR